MTHMEARDFGTGLGLAICISSVRNLIGTLLSSSCQTLIKKKLA